MILIERPALWQPSYGQGYARSQAEAANPGLWTGLIGAWHPPLGPTGLTLFDVSGRGIDGTLTNMAPATDCVVPIGEDKLIAGLKHVVDAQFYTAVSRRPAVYRGNPFIIEAAAAFGKPEPKEPKAGGAPARGGANRGRVEGGNPPFAGGCGGTPQSFAPPGWGRRPRHVSMYCHQHRDQEHR